jgi:hypothetical protein
MCPAPASLDTPPWVQSDPPELAFVSLWVSGPDPSVDGLLRIEALRRSAVGGLSRFERYCNPFPERDEPAASARMVREFGVDSKELQAAPSGMEAWEELREFLGERALAVSDAESFRAWSSHFERHRSIRIDAVRLEIEMLRNNVPGQGERAHEAHSVSRLRRRSPAAPSGATRAVSSAK